MNEFMVEDEEDKEETIGIYVDMQSQQKQGQAEAFLKEDRLTTAWQLANNNRKRIEGLEGAVAALTVLVIIVFLVVLALTAAILWRVI